jgi:precorrin-2 dehydrogenase/sirohydrochlorin ferrochelatase
LPRYFPIALNISGRKCVVVGGGAVAARRIASLLDADASVSVVSPTITPEIQQWVDEGHVLHEAMAYNIEKLNGALLVIAATNDPSVNAAITRDAQAMGILVNNAETSERGDFVIPSVVRQGDLLLMVTTGGASPSLTVKIREELEGQFGPEYEAYLNLLREAREEILKQDNSRSRAKHLLKSLVEDESILTLIREGRAEEAREKVFLCISSL